MQGGIRPAIRIQADLSRIAAYGIALDDLRTAVVGANVAGPKGALDGAHQSYTIAANDQITAADTYKDIVVAFRNGAPVKISDVADVVDGLENTKVAPGTEASHRSLSTCSASRRQCDRNRAARSRGTPAPATRNAGGR